MRAAFAALLLACACGGTSEAEQRTDADQPARLVVQDRYVVRESGRGFEETLSALLEALDRRDLAVFAVIDHAAAAGAEGLDLPPTTVVVFGDPRAGTRLMRAVPVLGAELPLRALVYERDGEVFLAMTGAANLGRTYPLGAQSGVLERIEDTLSEIAGEVTIR